jgi:fumarate hydratase subunit beta
MAEHHLCLPVSRDQIRDLRVGDTIFLSGEVTATGGLPAHKRMIACLDNQEAPPVPVKDALLHLPTMMDERDGRFEVRYVNPTTSTRFAGFMPRLIKEFDLRIVGGKGGLDAPCVEAMRNTGCVYVSLLGGGSPILSDAIERVVQVGWLDLPSHFRLMRLSIRELGPLTVGIDAHGNSLFEQLASRAKERLPEIRRRLDERRELSLHPVATQPIPPRELK